MMKIFILAKKKGLKINGVKSILVRKYWPHVRVIHKVLGGGRIEKE